jgi:hypothetical protein
MFGDFVAAQPFPSARPIADHYHLPLPSSNFISQNTQNNTPKPYFRICTPTPIGRYATFTSNKVKGAGNVIS